MSIKLVSFMILYKSVNIYWEPTLCQECQNAYILKHYSKKGPLGFTRPIAERLHDTERFKSRCAGLRALSNSNIQWFVVSARSGVLPVWESIKNWNNPWPLQHLTINHLILAPLWLFMAPVLSFPPLVELFLLSLRCCFILCITPYNFRCDWKALSWALFSLYTQSSGDLIGSHGFN